MDFRPSLRLLLRATWLLRVACWLALLYCVYAPWGELGGLVSEQLRWLERFVLLSVPVVGYTLGCFARDAQRGDPALDRGRLLRWLMYPVALTAATGLVLLALSGTQDPIGIVFTAFVGYSAGVDVAFGLVPHAADRSPSFGSRQRGHERAPWPPWGPG